MSFLYVTDLQSKNPEDDHAFSHRIWESEEKPFRPFVLYEQIEDP